MRNRLFVALILNEDSLIEINKFRERIYPSDNKVKWEGLDKLHLTIKYLGDVGEELIPKLNEKLVAIIKKHDKVEIKFAKFSVIKKYSVPKILWLGIKATKRLEDLFNDINFGLSELGFKKESRKFKPHITFLRLRGNEDILKLESLKNTQLNLKSSTIDEVALIKSDLRSTGSTYTKIKSFKLNTGGLNG